MRLQIRESLYDNGDLKTHGTIVNSVKERVYTSYVLIFHPLTICDTINAKFLSFSQISMVDQCPWNPGF